MDYETLCCERLLEWQQGKMPGPLHMTVFPTFRCNLNCAICSRHWHAEPRIKEAELTTERLIQLVDESNELGAQYWTIGGGGEPMVRLDAVVEMCRRVKRHNMIGSLQTNGTLFTPEAVEELVRANWDEVSISIDGGAARDSDRLRCAGAFKRATEAVRQFAEAKKKRGGAVPEIKVACVLSRLNADSLCEMVEKMHEIGANSIVFIQMIVYADEMAGLAPTADQFSRLRRGYERARALGRRLGIETALAVSLPGDVPAAHERREGKSPYTGALCVEPWLSVVVLPSGRCSPCCVFGDGITESLHERSLKEIWHGEAMQRIRRQVAEGPAPADCISNCQAHYVDRRARILACLEPGDTFSLNPYKLGKKALSSLRRNGFKTSYARGIQWLELRKKRSRTCR